MRYGDFLGSLSLASSHSGGGGGGGGVVSLFSRAHGMQVKVNVQPAQAARPAPRYCTRIPNMRSLSMCPSSNLWRRVHEGLWT